MPASLRTAGTRQNTWMITFSVGGQDFGVWDRKSGGEVDSEELKYNPGGMLPPISLGGSQNTGNITIGRYYDRIDDHGKINFLINAAGKKPCSVKQQPMDLEGNRFGATIVYNGMLKRVTIPETDSTSNEIAMIECEITVGDNPSAG
jgi:hypothetical protein